jgi:hypothetical protein
MSYSGFAGKEGNRPGEWYFEMTLEEIRKLFMIDKKKYKLTRDFRVYVIDKPIEDLNAAGIGLRIVPDYVRKGRFLIGVRFNCCWVKPDEGRNVSPATESEHERDLFYKAFPDEFEALKAEYLENRKKQPALFSDDYPEFHEGMAEAEAVKALRTKYPDFKQETKPKKKPGRPRKTPVPAAQ